MPTSGQSSSVQLNSEHVLWLSVLATSGLVIMWGIFWFAVRRSDESPSDILLNPAFFKTVSVMGVIAATVVLSLAGRLEGNLTGAILSGIVGYVLGTITGREKHSTEEKSDDAKGKKSGEARETH